MMLESVTVAAAVLAGILSFLSPCVLPLVPAYLGFISGASFEDLEAGSARARVLIPALWFVLGFTLVFMILGASATLLGQVLLAYRDLIARIGGVVIILLGLHLLGVFRLSGLLRERRLKLSSTPRGYLGATFAGVTFGAAWMPCLGPVLAAILTMAGIQETVREGQFLLAAYSTGLAIPFLLAAWGTARFLELSRKYRRVARLAERTSALLLIVIGLLLVTGSFTFLSATLSRYTPDFLLDRL